MSANRRGGLVGAIVALAATMAVPSSVMAADGGESGDPQPEEVVSIVIDCLIPRLSRGDVPQLAQADPPLVGGLDEAADALDALVRCPTDQSGVESGSGMESGSGAESGSGSGVEPASLVGGAPSSGSQRLESATSSLPVRSRPSPRQPRPMDRALEAPGTSDGDRPSGAASAAGAVQGAGTDGAGGRGGARAVEGDVLGRTVGRLVLRAPSAVPGGEVRLAGLGCEPGQVVEVFADGEQVGISQARPGGSFEIGVALPDDLEIGIHELEARCGEVSLIGQVDVVVATSAGASSASAGVVVVSFLLLAVLFTQGRSRAWMRRNVLLEEVPTTAGDELER